MKTYNLVLAPQADHTDRGHAILSGSQAERFMTCPGSVMLSSSATTENKSSEAAEEGTFAHMYAEFLFREVAGEDVTLPEIPAAYDSGLHEHCVEYVNHVLALPGETHIEVALDFSALHKNLGGTADVINIDFNDKVLRVGDLKYGRSQVYPKDNCQLMTYAVGALIMFDLWDVIDTVELMIFQPRGKNLAHTYHVATLEKFCKQLQTAAELTDDPFAPLRMTEKGCYWCKAKPICPEFAKKAKAAALSDFGLPVPKAKTASKIEPERLSEVLALAKQLAPWCEAVFQQAKDTLAIDEDALPGWALKPGRTMKSWTNDIVVAEFIYEATRRLKDDEKSAIYNVLVEQPKPLGVNALYDKIGDLQGNPGWSKAASKAIYTIKNDLADMVVQKQAAASLAQAK